MIKNIILTHHITNYVSSLHNYKWASGKSEQIVGRSRNGGEID